MLAEPVEASHFVSHVLGLSAAAPAGADADHPDPHIQVTHRKYLDGALPAWPAARP